MSEELVLLLLVLAFLFLLPLIASVLAVLAWQKVRRIDELERRVRALEHASGFPERHDVEIPVARPLPEQAPEGGTVVEPRILTRYEPSRLKKLFRTVWNAILSSELFLGQRLLAVIALFSFLFAIAFFLRHMFRIGWLTPPMRVALGMICGAALWGYGYWQLRRGLVNWGTLFFSAAALTLYASTYAAPVLYDLVDSATAASMLALLSGVFFVAAVGIDSLLLAAITVLGAMLVPILVAGPTDAYVLFFSYLLAVAAATCVATTWRGWQVISVVALCAGHVDFWLWYSTYYHPQKVGAVLLFLAVNWAVFLAFATVAATSPRPARRVEACMVFAVNAFLTAVALNRVLPDLHPDTQSTAALLMAAAHLEIARRWASRRLYAAQAGFVTGLSACLVAWGIALWFDAPWVAFGWAVAGSLLYAVGQHAEIALLRYFGFAFALVAFGYSVRVDVWEPREWPYLPILNRVGLPVIVGPAVYLVVKRLSAHLVSRRSRVERAIDVFVAFAALLTLWVVGSVEISRFFGDAASAWASDRWYEIGNVVLSAFWVTYALALLLTGFRLPSRSLRWCGILLLLITAVKVFTVDMASLTELQRALAFLAMAVGGAIGTRLYLKRAAAIATKPNATSGGGEQ